MEEKARQRFLIKLSYQGFLLEDHIAGIILTPRGITEPAAITITEALTGGWQVTSASGAYSRYLRGHHRQWFEALVNQLATQAIAELE